MRVCPYLESFQIRTNVFYLLYFLQKALYKDVCDAIVIIKIFVYKSVSNCITYSCIVGDLRGL